MDDILIKEKIQQDYRECPIAPNIFVSKKGDILDKAEDKYTKLVPAYKTTEKGRIPYVSYYRNNTKITFKVCVLVIATYFQIHEQIISSKINYRDGNASNCSVENLIYIKNIRPVRPLTEYMASLPEGFYPSAKKNLYVDKEGKFIKHDTSYGYYYINPREGIYNRKKALIISYKTQTILAAKIILETFATDIPTKVSIKYKDGNFKNIAYDNLGFTVSLNSKYICLECGKKTTFEDCICGKCKRKKIKAIDNLKRNTERKKTQKAERKNKFEELIKDLDFSFASKKTKETLKLRSEGLSYSEIGKIMGCSRQNIEQRINKAIERAMNNGFSEYQRNRVYEIKTRYKLSDTNCDQIIEKLKEKNIKFSVRLFENIALHITTYGSSIEDAIEIEQVFSCNLTLI